MNPTTSAPPPVIPPPIISPPATPPQSEGPKYSRNTLYIAITAVVLVVILGLGIAVFYQRPTATPAPSSTPPQAVPTTRVAPSPTPGTASDDLNNIEDELNRTPTAPSSGDKKVEGDINGL
jgi:cytoskeletal protein RodZ